MRCLSLFSGIGGIDLAATVSGFEIAAFCEIDPFCRGVLQTHWPDVPIYADVKEVSYVRLERDGVLPIDLVYGGPPCQPASLAGQRRGQQDDRWLWPQFLRVVGEVRPRWCVAENPVGILSVDAGRAWGTILGTLVEMGYCCGWGVWGAADVGAPHRRERVFLVGCQQSALADTALVRWRTRWAELPRQPWTLQPDGSRHARNLADSGSDRQREWSDQPEREPRCGDTTDSGLDGAQDRVADTASQRCAYRLAAVLSACGTASVAGVESEPERCRSLADAACGEDRRNGERGIPSNVASGRQPMADAQSGQRQRREPAWTGQSRSANRGDALDDATSARLEERAGVARNVLQERSSAVRTGDPERATAAGRVASPQCGLDRGADGFSPFVDHPCWPAGPHTDQAEWEPPRTIRKGVDPYRRKRLHALGNAVVPAQIAPLFRAIAEAETRSSGLSLFRRTKGSDEDGNDNN